MYRPDYHASFDAFGTFYAYLKSARLQTPLRHLWGGTYHHALPPQLQRDSRIIRDMPPRIPICVSCMTHPSSLYGRTGGAAAAAAAAGGSAAAASAAGSAAAAASASHGSAAAAAAAGKYPLAGTKTYTDCWPHHVFD